ncbi:MAG: hypothetical protein C0631_15445 [Sedimenticola sp.]|nr:MAG: hypothetical protein C0631_15445 [Sedimenticola sp.]
MSWIWEHKDWPDFRFDEERFQSRVEEIQRQADRLIGSVEALSGEAQAETIVDLLVSEAIKTSSIEGEELDRESVRSSIKAYLGFAPKGTQSRDPKAAGVAALMVDVRKHWNDPLTEELLCNWQSMVVQEGILHSPLRGAYRSNESPMQVVSGAIGYEQVHYEAPPSSQVPAEMARFIEWYNATAPIDGVEQIPGPIRAGIAHARFEHIHPFEDGNGRVGRAIVDHALSQAERFPALASLSTSIEQERRAYYEHLEASGKGGLDANDWLDFFVGIVSRAQELTKNEVEFIVGKTRYYDKFHSQLNERQLKAVGRIFAEGTKGFEGGLTTKKYMSITKCGRGTAFRDLNDLLEKGAVTQTGVGRGTRYELAKVESTLPTGWNRENSKQHGDREMGLAPNTFSDKEIESLEEKITEIYEYTDPSDDTTVMQALESADISQIEAALERLTDMDIRFNDLLADIAPSEWRVVSMDHEAFKERHDQATGSASHQLKDNLFKAVGKELDSDVWEANQGVNYVGDVVRLDQNYLYLQLSENSVSAHALNQMSPDQVEKLLDQIAVGDYVHVNEVGDAEKVERPLAQERDRGNSH